MKSGNVCVAGLAFQIWMDGQWGHHSLRNNSLIRQPPRKWLFGLIHHLFLFVFAFYLGLRRLLMYRDWEEFTHLCGSVKIQILLTTCWWCHMMKQPMVYFGMIWYHQNILNFLDRRLSSKDHLGKYWHNFSEVSLIHS